MLYCRFLRCVLLNFVSNAGQRCMYYTSFIAKCWRSFRIAMDNLTRYYKIAVIALLVLAYGSLVTIFLIENDSFPSIFYLWIIGGLLYSMTIVYATRIKTKNWILMTIILSGTVWIFPPL